MGVLWGYHGGTTVPMGVVMVLSLGRYGGTMGVSGGCHESHTVHAKLHVRRYCLVGGATVKQT